MTITTADLKFYQAERMTDNSDGGGQMSGNVIVSGNSNQIFDDISDVNRAAGSLSLRKIYAAVTSADTDKYLDSGAVIFKPPADPNASVMAFSTGSYYDERSALVALLETGIARGVLYHGYLFGQHLVGQRAILLWQRPNTALPQVGGRLLLVNRSSKVETTSQYVWITKVSSEERTFYDNSGALPILVVTLEIAEPLRYAFEGTEPSRTDSAGTSQPLVYDTRYNPDVGNLSGISALKTAGAVGDYTVQVNEIYQPLIPTGFQETALPDVTPGGDSALLVGGNTATTSFTTTTQCIKPDATLWFGSGVYPGSVSISVSGATITDQGGVMKLGGTSIGTIDYGNGVATWNSSCPNYTSASKTVTFRPATKTLQVADTAMQVVTVSNRGFVWVITLAPIPAPGSLRVSYRANGVWYVLNDNGSGALSGVDSSYGSGNLNYLTGTVTLTTGALPDVDSSIMYDWTTPSTYTERGGSAVDPLVVRGQTVNPAVARNTVSITWSGGSLTDDGLGALTGTGGSGTIRYSTGAWSVTPTTIPASGTVFTIAYQWGEPLTQTFNAPLREQDGSLILTLDNPDVLPGSVEIIWNLLIDDYDAISTTPAEMQIRMLIDPYKTIVDDGAGVLPISGGTDGTIDYVTGEIAFLPDVTVSIPWPRYTVYRLGFTLEGGVAVSAYRNVFREYEYKPAGASMPYDESGIVTVTYRVSDSPTVASETYTLSQIELDLTKEYAETIVAGSTRFALGSNLYVDRAGVLYRNPSPETGAGELAGSLDRTTGTVRLSAWETATNSVNLISLTTAIAVRPLDYAVWRSPIAPIKPGTVQLRYTEVDGTVRSKTIDLFGGLVDSHITATVEASTGVMTARFGMFKVVADLTPEELLEPWYDPEAIVEIGGVDKIWKPRLVYADSLVYNAVASSIIPPDSTLLGIDAARLSPDGKALIYRTGKLLLVHHTDTITQANLSPTQVIDCGRVRLYRVVIDDANNQRLPASFYTVNRELGTATMAANLDLTGYSGPYSIQHTVADLARTTAVDINGTLTLNKQLSHDYPADDSYASSVLFIGTLQARYTNLFAQATWTSVWSDTRIGDAPLAQYNDTAYPVQVSNSGAYKDRILIKFTSSTAFQVIGEQLGVIATGNINENCSPVNQLTGQPYFTIDYLGWGAGWATGNCVRFNLIGANYPVDLTRAIQPSDPTGLDDSVELLFIGNVDA